jgi:hypothetical protein
MNLNQPFSGGPQMSVAQMQNGSGVAPNLSGTDLSSVFGGEVQSSGGLMVQFFYHRVRIGGKQTSTGKFETRLAVALKPRGDMLTLAVRPITEEEAQRQFPGEWQQFKMYMDTPTRGTPLYELPGATQSMIAILVLGGIRSIEDLVNLPADVCSQMGMDATHAQNLAKVWIQRKNGAADDIGMAERLAALEIQARQGTDEVARLRAENAAQAQALELLRGMGMGGGGNGVPAQGGNSDVVPAVPMGVPSFLAPRERDDAEDNGQRDGSDMFTATALINDMSGMKNPLED